ncbi:MAG: Transcriptional regulator TrmB [uncultured bacterium]|nr:MAG: Transcriptional regulator TrmB [uncultured bacterium]
MFDENGNKEILGELQKLGLKEKESQVYLALLELGEVGSSKIIKRSELHGQYVYDCLESLEEKGLVQHLIKNGRKKFIAKNPKTLIGLIERQKVLASSVAEKLKEVMIMPPHQHFETYQGKESYIAYEFELLKNAPEHSEFLIIGGSGDDFAKSMGKNLYEYEKIRVAKKVSIRYIGSEDQKKDLIHAKNHRESFDYRILPGLFTGMVNTNIWPDSIGFNIFGSPVTSFSITNPIIAGSYKQFFETLWKMGK